MSDQFAPIPFPHLVELALAQVRRHHFFGISEKKFFRPGKPNLSVVRFGQTIDTPLGVAAGPHSQMAQNIVAAWLCGARYLELKTVQTLDRIAVAKPCIDMQDEGYNCEWSQELSLEESFDQYLDAWILIHILHHELGFEGSASGSMVFNMSVGYNMQGILNENVQQFLNSMSNCRIQLEAKINQLSQVYPLISQISIPCCISSSVTLSTMHGCPPEEIEQMGRYLISERKLHTIIKLNPTLLGPQKVRQILNHQLGYQTPVPDEAFEHDLKYEDALQLLDNLTIHAKDHGVAFGVKLTNTLESLNFKKVFPASEKQMYMSGKALHPIAINLAAKLRDHFGSELDISFSAGIDAFNVSDVLACGFHTVTVCSDLLKPGGYARMNQYVENIEAKVRESKATSLLDWIALQPEGFLSIYAGNVVHNPAYQKPFRNPSVKTPRHLTPFDCIQAPCVNTCPGNQDIPEYLYHTAHGDFEKAFEVVSLTNPLPNVTGTVCDHDCQTRCTRINYDNPIAIREVKRFVALQHQAKGVSRGAAKANLKASIIGAGPSGLACAWYLRQSGFAVTVFEAADDAGGMVSKVIPGFRISRETLDSDIHRIVSSGVEVRYGHKVDEDFFRQLVESGDYVYVATGSPISKPLGVEGENSEGVLNPLDFLASCKAGRVLPAGMHVVVVGGGNTAMDVARSARRTLAKHGTVTLVYRRSISQMPAEEEEIRMALAEGVKLIEMAAPVSIVSNGGRVEALKCVRTRFSGEDTDGRSRVEAIDGIHFLIQAEVVIPAIGQVSENTLAVPSLFKTSRKGYATQIPKVYIGGDARNGAANIITAVADGRRAAVQITQDAREAFPDLFGKHQRQSDLSSLMLRKSIREFSRLDPGRVPEGSPLIRNAAEAVAEASRCLLCDEICDICVTVCPNLANQSFETAPVSLALKKIVRKDDQSYELLDDELFVVNQAHQVFNIGNFCNECGNCTTFCPTSGAPFRDKPTFWLTSESFEEADEGYFVDKSDEPVIIRKLADGATHVLRQSDGCYTYDSPDFSAILQKDTFFPTAINFHNHRCSEVLLREAASMSVLMSVRNELYFSNK